MDAASNAHQHCETQKTHKYLSSDVPSSALMQHKMLNVWRVMIVVVLTVQKLDA